MHRGFFQDTRRAGQSLALKVVLALTLEAPDFAQKWGIFRGSFGARASGRRGAFAVQDQQALEVVVGREDQDELALVPGTHLELDFQDALARSSFAMAWTGAGFSTGSGALRRLRGTRWRLLLPSPARILRCFGPSACRFFWSFRDCLCGALGRRAAAPRYRLIASPGGRYRHGWASLRCCGGRSGQGGGRGSPRRPRWEGGPVRQGAGRAAGHGLLEGNAVRR